MTTLTDLQASQAKTALEATRIKALIEALATIIDAQTTAQLDTDATMAANSDTRVATQKATKTALATKPTATLSTDGTMAANSDANVPSQKAVKTYADTKQTLNAKLTAIAGLSLTGQQGKVLAVNASEDGFEFIAN